MDHSLRTPIEVEKHLGKPVLAVLPRMDANKKGGAAANGKRGDNRPEFTQLGFRFQVSGFREILLCNKAFPDTWTPET